MKNKNSKAWRRWLKLSVAALPLSVICVAASAGIIDVGFDTAGSATWGASCGTSCTDLTLTGTTSVSGLDGYFGGSATPNFSFSALLNVTPGWIGSSAVGNAPTGGWRLQDTLGDSLYGSVDGWLSGMPGDLAGVGIFDFAVSGGTGLFGGASGSGGALSDFSWSGNFRDAGGLLVHAPSVPTTTVPEPGTLVLFGFGLAGLGWSLQKRGFARTTRRVIGG